MMSLKVLALKSQNQFALTTGIILTYVTFFTDVDTSLASAFSETDITLQDKSMPFWIFQEIFEKTCTKEQLLRFKSYELTPEELLFYKSKVVINSEFCGFDLCKATQQQLKSQIWFEERKLRITASKAHQILK